MKKLLLLVFLFFVSTANGLAKSIYDVIAERGEEVISVRDDGSVRANLSSMRITDISDIDRLLDLNPDISHLNLSENRITTLPEGVFESFKKLRVLSLAGNGGVLIRVGAFEGIGLLEILDLRYCGLTDRSFAPEVFNDLTRLRSLFLSHNNLSRVPNISRQTLLEICDLGYNEIRLAGRSDFSCQDHLEVLHLDHNEIVSIREDLLPGLFGDAGKTNIRMLRLDNNNIKDIDISFFENLPGIAVVDLSHNEMLERDPERVRAAMRGVGYQEAPAAGSFSSFASREYAKRDSSLAESDTEEAAHIRHLYKQEESDYQAMRETCVSLLKRNNLVSEDYVNKWVSQRVNPSRMRTDSGNRWVFLNRHRGKIIFGACLAIGIATGIGVAVASKKAAVLALEKAGELALAQGTSLSGSLIAKGVASGVAAGGLGAALCPDRGDYVLEQDNGEIFLSERHLKLYRGTARTVALFDRLLRWLLALNKISLLAIGDRSFGISSQVSPEIGGDAIDYIDRISSGASSDPLVAESDTCLYKPRQAITALWEYRMFVLYQSGPASFYPGLFSETFAASDMESDQNTFLLLSPEQVETLISIFESICSIAASYRKLTSDRFMSRDELLHGFRDIEVLVPLRGLIPRIKTFLGEVSDELEKKEKEKLPDDVRAVYRILSKKKVQIGVLEERLAAIEHSE